MPGHRRRRAPVHRVVIAAGVVSLLGAVLWVPAPVTAGAPAPAPKNDEPLPAVQSVLDARSAAVMHKDRPAFLATVDPSAPAAFRQAQSRQVDGLLSLPLASYALRASTDEFGDLGTGLSAHYGGAPVFVPETRQVYRLEGYDDRDAVDHLWLTFVQRHGTWYVGGDADLDPLGIETDRQLWDAGPVVLQRTDHVLVLSHPAQAERAAALAAIAEEAAVTFTGRWTQPWSGRFPVILPGSVDELGQLLHSTVDLDKFVAFTAYGAERQDGWTSTAPRILVQDVRLGAYSRPAQVETLVHEIAHLAAAPLAGPFIPGWVHEGLADWVATGRRAGELRPAGGDGRFPRDFELSTGPSAAIIRAYRESRSAVSLLAARRGPGAPSAFFAALGAIRVAPGSVDHNTDAALRAQSGLSLGELEAAWAARSPR